MFTETTTESKTSEVDMSPNKTPTVEVVDSIVSLEEEPQNTFEPETVVSTILNKPSDLKASVPNDESQMNVKDLEPLNDSQTSTESQFKEKIQTVEELKEPETSHLETVEYMSHQFDQDLRNIEPETSENLETISIDQLDEDDEDLENFESISGEQLDQDYMDLKDLESTADDQLDEYPYEEWEENTSTGKFSYKCQ